MPAPNQKLLLALRTLQGQLVAVHPFAPYSTARLQRLTEQLAYFVEHWPLTQWPTSSRAGEPMPLPGEVHATLQRLRYVLRPLPLSITAVHLAEWQLAASLLKDTLALFL